MPPTTTPSLSFFLSSFIRSFVLLIRRSISLKKSTISLKELTDFTRHLYLLLQAHLPLLEACQILSQERLSPLLSQALTSIINSLYEGKSFSSSLATFPEIFPHHYLALVQIGEESATLRQLLQEIVRLQEEELQRRGTLQTALLYPVIVILVALLLVGLLITFVIPQFRQLFEESFQGAALPAPTRFLLASSSFLTTHGWSLLAGTATFLLLLLWLQHSPYQQKLTQWRQKILEYFLLELPIPLLSSLYRKSLLAQLSQILGTLLAERIPILEAIELTHNSLKSLQAREALTALSEQLQQGANIAPTLSEHRLFSTKMISMIRVGEATGNCAPLLLQLSTLYLEESHQEGKRLLACIEPAVILLLALIVGGIVVALFLPLTSMIDQLSLQGLQ